MGRDEVRTPAAGDRVEAGGAQVVRVETSGAYDVVVGRGLLAHAGERVRAALPHADGAALVVSDDHVAPLYARTVLEGMRAADFACELLELPHGEQTKCLEQYGRVLEAAARARLTRSSTVVALGGGVIGDLAGFAAATYMRGVNLVQLATSLLAMVDSSVGGKTAIDLAGGKNLAGAFWQPRAVIADVGCLATLEPAQFADGCGEVVKHAVIADARLFDELERTPLTPDLLRADVARTARLIARNIDIKRAVVESDEREAGARKLLNLGHSIGHAVEAAEDYALGHGNCVAIGTCLIARAAAGRGWCAADAPDRIEGLLSAHGLVTRTDRGVDELYAHALHDKKRRGDSIDLVIPRAIGSCSIQTVPLPAFRDLISEGLAAQGPTEGSAA